MLMMYIFLYLSVDYFFSPHNKETNTYVNFA